MLMNAARLILIVGQKIIHRIGQWPSKIVHQIYLRSHMAQRKEKDRLALMQLHNQYLPKLEDEEIVLGQNLTEQGFCMTECRLFDTFQDDNFAASAKHIYDVMEDHYIKTGESIDIVKLLSANPLLLGQFKTVFRAGLDTKLLRIIEHYLRFPVAYGGVDFFLTIADGSERGARTWHKDSEDNTMIKVAVYLNDVDDNGGPFEILQLQQDDPITRTARGFFHQDLVDLQDKNKIKFEILSFTGPSGAVIFCDTFKYFHRGKPAIGKNRRALFFNYYTEMPLTPYFCPNPPFSSVEMENLVADLSTKQKDAALWREKLAGFDRFVTKTTPYLNS